MKDFPNYLLKKQEKILSNSSKKTENVWQAVSKKQTFHPSNVPSILKGITREQDSDYTAIKDALRLKNDDILLFETTEPVKNERLNNEVSLKIEQPINKRTGLHRTFQQLIIENEHDHFILTKGDNHER